MTRMPYGGNTGYPLQIPWKASLSKNFASHVSLQRLECSSLTCDKNFTQYLLWTKFAEQEERRTF
jgi:hypothetical protein